MLLGVARAQAVATWSSLSVIEPTLGARMRCLAELPYRAWNERQVDARLSKSRSSMRGAMCVAISSGIRPENPFVSGEVRALVLGASRPLRRAPRAVPPFSV